MAVLNQCDIASALNWNRAGVTHMKYRSNEDRLKAVVQRWLQAGGIPRSWRWLVWSLDWAGENAVADPIRGFAEPPQGESS